MRVTNLLFAFLLSICVAQAARGQKQVAGLIDGETWSAAQSPIHVTGNLDVLQLTIEAGVTVLFEGNYRMKILGVLNAAGTEQDSIVFEAAESNAAGWAGLYFNNASANSTLSYCRVSDVTANPALQISGTDLTIKHTVIKHNEASGLTITNSAVTLERCNILNNGQTGIVTDNNGQVELIACRIFSNGDRGVETAQGQITARNSLIAFNAEEGILLSATGDALECVNSVVAYNGKEGIVNIDGTHTVKNSIIYFNSAVQQIATVSGGGEVSYSAVEQLITGVGNIMQDPQFASTRDFTLGASSPAIDAGDPSTVFEDRYFPPSQGGQRNDMGAYGGPYARKWYPPLFSTPDTLDFGNVSLGDSLTLVLTIKNYSDDVLTIQQIVLSGADQGYFSIEGAFDNLSLPMADSLLVPVTFHPTQTSSLPLTANLQIDTNLGQKQTPLVGMVVMPNILILSDALDFGAQAVSQVDSQQVKIFNTGTDTLFIDSLKSNTSSFSATLSQSELPPYSGDYISLMVYFHPDTIGAILDTLRIFSNDPDDSVRSVYLSGEGLAPVLKTDPDSIAFDSVLIFSDSLRQIEIRNQGNTALTIHSMAFKNQDSRFTVDFSSEVEIEAQGSPLAIDVRFTPDSTRFYSDTLLIASDDPFSPLVRIPVTGAGIAALVRLPVERVDFGQLTMPDDSLTRLIIRNGGNIDLQIKSMTIVGDDAGSFSWWKVGGDLIIAPQNDSLSVYLRCLPQRSGALNAVLKIVSNDALNPEFQLPLAAFVKAAELTFEPDSVRFDSVMLFDQKTQIVKIFNRGDYQLFIDSLSVTLPQNSDLTVTAFNVPKILQPQIDTLSFPVSFFPQKAGWQEASVKIFSNDPFRNPRVLTIRALGVEPVLQALTDTLDFGRYSLYRQPVQSLFLKNAGNAPVVIDSIVLGNPAVFSLAEPTPQRIAAGADPLSLNIRFTPQNVGRFESDLTIYWNNPYHQPYVLRLIGEADSVHFTVQPMLDFGKQIIHSDAQQTLEMRNNSRVVFYVDSIRLSGPNADAFSLPDFEFPLALNPEDSLLTFKITYRPQQTGLHLAQVQIYSQDLAQRQLSVNLRGVALYSSAAPLFISSLNDTCDFGAVFVQESGVRSFSLFNLGNGVLMIDSSQISGAQASTFSLEPALKNMTIAADDSLTSLLIKFNPTAAGSYSATLIIYSNDPERSPFTIPLLGRGKIDPTPAQVNFEPDSLRLVLGEQATVHFTIADDSTTIQSAALYLRPGASDEYQTLPLQFSPDEGWTARIPADWITVTGLEAYFEIEHGGRTTIFPENGAQNPLYFAVQIPEVQFPYFTRKEKYQMISLPFVTDRSLADLFTDDLGAYNAERYRLFDWDAQQLKFVELKQLETVLPPGKALYLIARDSLQLDAGSLQSVPTNRDFEIPVASGWNMIANPFPFPVAWQEVTQNWPEAPVLYYYTGTGWIIANVLEPYKGYAVKISDRTAVAIPPSPAQNTLARRAILADLDWQFQLTARSGIYEDEVNFVGACSATDDRLETAFFPEPPTIGSFVSLYFENDDGQKMAADIRAAGEEGYQFDFRVNWNTSLAAYVNIKPDSLPEGWTWKLVSLTGRLCYSELPAKLSSPGVRLRLIVGSADFVQKESEEFLPVPEQFQLSQNFPNPFNQSTTFKLQLPEADRLTIEIFDINGRRVKTLVKNFNFEAGYHQFKWNGKNSRNSVVASGMYFLRLKGAKYSAIKKIILQK